MVEAAGNGNENLDDPIYEKPGPGFDASWANPFKAGGVDSGAIIVGAGAPPPQTHGQDHGPDRSRLYFSDFGTRVDVQGWGDEVTSAGGQYDQDGNDVSGDLQGGDDPMFWYTDHFGGTSSATPMVAGCLACVQGILRARNEEPLTPLEARQLLRKTGSPQVSNAPSSPAPLFGRIGNRPDLKQLIAAALKLREPSTPGSPDTPQSSSSSSRDGISASQAAESRIPPGNAFQNPPAEADLKPNSLAVLTEEVWRFLNEKKAPGAALAVSFHGKIVYSGGFGFADQDTGKSVTRASLFRIASLSKPLTAAAIFHLIDRGQLSLEDHPFELLKINPWLEPGAHLDDRLKRVTVYQLLTHTCGWDRDRSTDQPFECKVVSDALGVMSPPDPAQTLRYIFGRPLDYEPGSRYAYSNAGYLILGRVIEQKAGMPYEEYVRREILAPLGIHDMHLGESLERKLDPNEVHYYSSDGGWGIPVEGDQRERCPRVYGAWSQRNLDSAAGWIASAEDLAKFCASFDHGASVRIVSERSAEIMFSPPRPLPLKEPRDGEQPYACGWFVVTGGGERFHDGLLEGTSTIMLRRPNGLSWALAFNSDYTSDGKEFSDAAYFRLCKLIDNIPAVVDGAAHDLVVPSRTTGGKDAGYHLNPNRSPDGAQTRNRSRTR